LADRRRNWVVIAGLVRDEAAFARQLEVQVDWRKQQLVEGVVYCTWIDELSKYPGIAGFLSNQDIPVVEVAEPSLRLEGHILHQMTSLHYALQLVPDGSYVFRTRPDMRTHTTKYAAAGSVPAAIHQRSGLLCLSQLRCLIVALSRLSHLAGDEHLVDAQHARSPDR
jgi:hypothetical protein